MLKLLLITLLLPLAGLAGCAVTHQTSMLVGTPRAATSPIQVKLYTTPPRKYVEIAVISADAAHDFMEKQALLDTAVMNAKREAAKVGANGILLEGAGDFEVGSSGVMIMQAPRRGGMAFATGSSNTRTGKQIAGKAIYVTEE
ncbi:hypothetical protein [Variovorax soli]|uniref:Zn-dependent protease with chaperone function n=1 Tax=Variovorax soli TaxID=376815 RepID=A0ABU1NFA0_9BURK|nr:hypothetical protein [Variovorax soli]MDR6536977.1 Zn-dependent protease with chaperone function [Variovorax soli]